LKSGASASEITAIVSADTYITKKCAIELEDLSDGNLDVQLKLISKDTAGAVTAEVTETVTDATTPNEITGSVAEGQAAANVAVVSGTILQGADGNAILGTTVTLSIVTVDTSTSSGAVFTPEGLNTTESATTLTPVGVVSAVMLDNNGVKIKKPSQPIAIEMALPDDKVFTTGDELTLL
jgi:hypothetical protein